VDLFKLGKKDLKRGGEKEIKAGNHSTERGEGRYEEGGEKTGCWKEVDEGNQKKRKKGKRKGRGNNHGEIRKQTKKNLSIGGEKKIKQGHGKTLFPEREGSGK